MRTEFVSVFVDGVLGVLVFERFDERSHHSGELCRVGSGEVVLLVGVAGEVEALVVLSAGLDVVT